MFFGVAHATGELLDAKLRPVHERLDELSKRLDQRIAFGTLPEEREGHPKRLVALLVTTMLAIAAVVLAGRMVLGTADGSRQTSSPTSGRLLFRTNSRIQLADSS